MTYGSSVRLTKETILSKISESQIFQYYLGYTPQEGKRFLSPHFVRSGDTRPDCYFYSKDNKIRFRDPAIGFDEDCFGIVMKSQRCNYPVALETIAKDFGLYGWSKKGQVQIVDNRTEEIKLKEKTRARFTLRLRKWSWEDAAYWKQFYITREILEKFGVLPVKAVWLNDSELPFYIYSDGDPCYAYTFPDKTVKLYFPCRDKGNRFRNNSTYIQGLNLLPERGENLILTKSYKDVMAMYRFDIPAIAPQAESNISVFTPEFVNGLKRRFNNIYSLYDWDRAGIKGALRLRNEYGIQPLFFTNSEKCNFLGAKVKIDFGEKDFTDNLKVYGEQDMIDIIRYVETSILLKEFFTEDIIPF